jgi:hypothetical protein
MRQYVLGAESISGRCDDRAITTTKNGPQAPMSTVESVMRTAKHQSEVRQIWR